MADGGGRPPRWDPDDRGIGVGDTRAFEAVLDADGRAIRAAAFGLISQIAEGTTLVHERRAEQVLSSAVVTGDLPGETRFATHGHTLILTIDDPGGLPSTVDGG